MLKKLILLALSVTALVLEITPYGAVMVWMPSPDETLRTTTTYFSLLPIGYGMYGYMLTAIATVVLTILTIVALVKRSKIHKTATAIISAVGIIMSVLSWVMFGTWYISGVGIAITALLICETVVALAVKE